MDAYRKNAKLIFLSAGLTVFSLAFLYESYTLVTYLLLGYFPDKTAAGVALPLYRDNFYTNMSFSVCLFFLVVLFKLAFDHFAQKNTDVLAESKSYVALRYTSILVLSVMLAYLACYPVSFYLSGGTAPESLASLASMLILASIIYPLVFKSRISGGKYLTPSLLILSLAFISAVGYADFSIYGFPSEIASGKADIKRANDLSMIDSDIQGWSTGCNTGPACDAQYVPKDLYDLASKNPSHSIHDPITNELYSYTFLPSDASSTRYSVCATFNSDFESLVSLFGKDALPGDFDSSNLKQGVSCIQNFVYTDAQDNISTDGAGTNSGY